MIRAATTSDIPRILEMGRAFADEAGVTDMVGWSDKAVTTLLEQMIETDAGILLVSDTGMIGGIVYAHPFSGTLVFQELFWRSHGFEGIKLLKAAEAEAKAKGAVKSIMIGIDSMPSVHGLYGKLGYKPMERLYSREL